LHSDTSGVQGLDLPAGSAWLNHPDTVDALVRKFAHKILLRFSRNENEQDHADFIHMAMWEASVMNTIFLSWEHGAVDTTGYARGIWNTPEQLGHFARLATGMSGENRTVVKEMMVVFTTDLMVTYNEHVGTPVEEWGWKLDALIENVSRILLGLPQEDLSDDE